MRGRSGCSKLFVQFSDSTSPTLWYYPAKLIYIVLTVRSVSFGIDVSGLPFEGSTEWCSLQGWAWYVCGGKHKWFFVTTKGFCLDQPSFCVFLALFCVDPKPTKVFFLNPAYLIWEDTNIKWAFNFLKPFTCLDLVLGH